jgi:hypothetical protein
MGKHRVRDEEEARELFGPKWAWRYREDILAEVLDVTYPYAWVALLDNRITEDDYEEMMGGAMCPNVTFKTVEESTPEVPHGPYGFVYHAGRWHSSAAVIDEAMMGKPGRTVTVLKDGTVIAGALALAE